MNFNVKLLKEGIRRIVNEFPAGPRRGTLALHAGTDALLQGNQTASEVK